MRKTIAPTFVQNAYHSPWHIDRLNEYYLVLLLFYKENYHQHHHSDYLKVHFLAIKLYIDLFGQVKYQVHWVPLSVFCKMK